MDSWPITHVGLVYPAECDHLGHLNVAYYVAKFDQASWNLMARFGVDRASIDADKRAFAAVDQHIRYHRELRTGDTLTVRSAIRAIGGKTCRFTHVMTNNHNDGLAATCDLVVVYMDTEARRALPIPDHVIARALPLIDAAEETG